MISIIVPVYKTEKYIRECLDSILSQTYKDWELILVDDGSPDKSGRICDEYAEKDQRIQVIHQKNSGVSVARNRGIEEAKGEYVAFIDADDIVSSTYLEDFAPKGDDLYIGGFNRFGEIENRETCTDSMIRSAVKDTRLYWETLLKKSHFFAPWCKLFKTDIVKNRNICFPLGMKNAEDIHFCLEYIIYAKRVVTIPQANYNLRYVGSEANRKYSVNTKEYKFHIKKILDQIDRTEMALDIKLPYLRRILTFRFWSFYITWMEQKSYLMRIVELFKYTVQGLFRYCPLRDALSLYYRIIAPHVYKFAHKK